MKPIDLLTDEEFAELAQRASRMPDAPAAALRAAVNLWRAAPPSPLQVAAGSLLKRVMAVLTFDSWGAGAPAFGVRGVPSATRHLLFSARGRDIDLRITPSADRFALAGQILGPDESGMIELAGVPAAGGPQAAPRSTALDPLGEFRLEGIASGAYVLTLRLGEEEIVLPPIDLGESRP